MAQSQEIGKLLAFMIDNPDKFRYQSVVYGKGIPQL